MSTGRRYDHSLCLAADFVKGDFPELLDDYLNGLVNDVLVVVVIRLDSLGCRWLLVLGILLDSLGDLVGGLDGGIILQDVHNELLVYGLTH